MANQLMKPVVAFQKRSKAEWVEYANQHAWSIGRTDIEWYIDKAGEIQIGRPLDKPKRIAA